MKNEDLSSLSQLIESMNLAVEELEKAMGKQNAEKIKESKKEIINFHREIKKIIEEKWH